MGFIQALLSTQSFRLLDPLENSFNKITEFVSLRFIHPDVPPNLKTGRASTNREALLVALQADLLTKWTQLT